MHELLLNHKFSPGDEVIVNSYPERSKVLRIHSFTLNPSDNYPDVVYVLENDRGFHFHIAERNIELAPQKFTVELEAKFRVGDEVSYGLSQTGIVTKAYPKNLSSGIARMLYDIDFGDTGVNGVFEEYLSLKTEDESNLTSPSD